MKRTSEVLSRRFVATLVGTVLAMQAGLCAAQNSLTQADFDKNADGWNSSGTWSASPDADDCDVGSNLRGSGSLGADSVLDQGWTWAVIASQACIPVAPDSTIFTEIRLVSPFAADVFPTFYSGAGCTGIASPATADLSFEPSMSWSLRAESFVVPADALSMQVSWAAVDFDGTTYSTRWDRAYAGTQQRVFADDFEAGRGCRWSSSIGFDTVAPTMPTVSSSSHDGGPAPSPIHINWGGSTDLGGSGVAGYRYRVSTSATVPACNDTIPILYGGAGAIAGVFSATWYGYVCSEDLAGNQSLVAVGGPWVVP